jgi:hypothetical protein
VIHKDDQRDRQTELAIADQQICIRCRFLKLNLYVAVSKSKVDTWAVQLDIVSIFNRASRPGTSMLLFLNIVPPPALRQTRDRGFEHIGLKSSKRKHERVANVAAPNVQHTPALMHLEHGKQTLHLFSRNLPLELNSRMLPN